MRDTDDRGKLDIKYNFRISSTLASEVDRLSPAQKSEMHDRMRIEMARAVHNSKFNPSVYLNGI